MTATRRTLAPGITSDPQVSFGRACVAGTGIPAAIIAERFRAGDIRDALAAAYGLTGEQVQAALEYVKEMSRRGGLRAAG